MKPQNGFRPTLKNKIMTEKNTAARSKGLTLIANIVSVLLHPVFMPLLGFALIYYALPTAFENTKPKIFAGWLGMVVINTIVFPLILMLLLKGLGFIKSILLKDVKERVIPLIGTMVFYFWAYLVMKNVNAPDAARILFLGNFWGIVVVFIATIMLKVSMHTAGVGSLLGLLIVLLLMNGSFLITPFLLVLIAVFAISWARYYLQAHTAKELILGLSIGVATQLAAYVYLILF